MKVAIVGSRLYGNLDEVRAYVRELPRDTIVVSGGARGVDWVAEDEARVIRLSRYIIEPTVDLASNSRAEYTRALLKRNEVVARLCDRMTAFWDGTSNGTRRTFEYARSLGKEVEVIRWPRS